MKDGTTCGSIITTSNGAPVAFDRSFLKDPMFALSATCNNKSFLAYIGVRVGIC